MPSAHQEDYPAPSYQQVPFDQLLYRHDQHGYHHHRQASSPSASLPLKSPERHHRRALSAPRATKVKETLDARVTKREDGVRMLNQYLLKQEIGRGSYGTVLLAEDSTTGKEYAIKEFSKARLRKRNHSALLRSRPRTGLSTAAGGPGRGRGGRPILPSRRSVTDIHRAEEDGNPLFLIRSEIAIMKKLDHENVVDLLEVLDDPDGDSLYMVLELCKKGVVMNVGFGANACPYADEECRHWFRDLILGIEYLHAQGIAHRDIKPDNLLLSSDRVLKIVDFGVSELFEVVDAQRVAQSGSPAFMSPELCRGVRDSRFLKPSDIWSMGVTLFCWKFGTLPYGETNIIALCAQIINERPDILDPAFERNKRHLCDDNLLDLFDRLLEKDPERRISMAELRRHPWVTLDGEDELLSVEENTAQMIDEITEDDLRLAIKGIRGVVTVVKAVNKLKQMRASSRAASREASPERRRDHDHPSGSPSSSSTPPPPRRLSNTMDPAPDEEYIRDLASASSPRRHQHTRRDMDDATEIIAERLRRDSAIERDKPEIVAAAAAVVIVSDDDDVDDVKEDDGRGRETSRVPSPTIGKRSSSADEALWRNNSTEDRILTHAREGLDPGREFDKHPVEYFVRHHSDQLSLAPVVPQQQQQQEETETEDIDVLIAASGAVPEQARQLSPKCSTAHLETLDLDTILRPRTVTLEEKMKTKGRDVLEYPWC